MPTGTIKWNNKYTTYDKNKEREKEKSVHRIILRYQMHLEIANVEYQACLPDKKALLEIQFYDRKHKCINIMVQVFFCCILLV